MKITSFLVILCLCTCALAQSPFETNIQWGQPSVSNGYITEPLGTVNNRLYYSNWMGLNKYTIDEYDAGSLNIISTSKLDLKYEKENLDFITTFVTKDKLMFITKTKNKGRETQTTGYTSSGVTTGATGTRVSAPSSAGVDQHYYFGDILIVSSSGDGKKNWGDVIQKSQHSVNDLGRTSSYFTLVANDKFYIIFNDSELQTTPDELENSKLSEKRKAKKQHGSCSHGL